jgi:flavin reductase (DIM6/NTAB) family NADH-FMN oxidoreductase RutF
VNTDETRLAPDTFRHVIGHFASGVTIITTRDDDGRDYGMTANAVTSLSLEPPMLLACLNAASTTRRVVSRTRTFAVNILAADQGALAARFARRGGDKFADIPRSYGPLGQPLLGGALACIECEVAEEIPGGTHLVFLAKAGYASARAGAPLTYFRGTFGRFDRQQDQRHDHKRLPRPVDDRIADQAFEAKLVIDLGVARLLAGRTDPWQVAELRRLAETMLPLVVDGRITDTDAYIRAGVAFHEYVITLTGNDTLLDAYRRLSIADIMARALSHPDPLRERLTRGRVRLADAYERGDLARIESIIINQHRLSRRVQHAATASARGA